MTDWNTKIVFDALEEAAIGQILEGVIRGSGRSADSLKNFVEDYFARAFPYLANAIGSGGLDGDDVFHPEWDDHSPMYANRKFRAGAPQGFMRYRGWSKEAIWALGVDWRSIFGSPTIQVQIVAGGATYSYTYDRRNRLRYAKGSRNEAGKGIGGQFAKTIPELANARVSIGMISPMVGGIGSTISPSWIRKNINTQTMVFEYGRKARTVTKMQHTGWASKSVTEQVGGQPARPLIRPFLQWYLGTHFRKQLREWQGLK